MGAESFLRFRPTGVAAEAGFQPRDSGRFSAGAVPLAAPGAGSPRASSMGGCASASGRGNTVESLRPLWPLPSADGDSSSKSV